MQQTLPVSVNGHVHIEDDLGHVLLDKDNAIHSQNMARVIARSLSNENNYYIHRIAFGNGGTIVDAAYTITYNPPNDGQDHDTATWGSRLYNETYSEIVDEGNTVLNNDLGTDPGSSGPNVGDRPGGGADPANDPPSVPHVSGPGVRSNELGLTSEVVVTAVLNPNEPRGQFSTDNQTPTENTETSFMFDEIGLFTSGGPAIDSSGSHSIDVGDRRSEDDTGLLAGTEYSFNITVDNLPTQQISFTTPLSGGSGVGGEILYGDLCEAINTGDIEWNAAWAGSNPLPTTVGFTKMAITDTSGNFPSISGEQTYGFLRFMCGSAGEIEVGVYSQVEITAGTVGLDLLASVNPPTGGIPQAPVLGSPAGVQNDPVNPTEERERMLSHLIFSPVLKSKNRTLVVTYTLTVSVARSS